MREASASEPLIAVWTGVTRDTMPQPDSCSAANRSYVTPRSGGSGSFFLPLARLTAVAALAFQLSLAIHRDEGDQLIQDFLKTAAASEMHPVYRSKLLACRRKGTVRTALGRGPFPAPGLDSSAGRSY